MSMLGSVSLLRSDFLFRIALAVALLLPLCGLQAQDYPSKPVRFVVPYPPGGGTDVIARLLQERLSKLLGQTVLIENRGGAAGSLGTEIVAKAPADGYTVLFTLSSHTINPAIYSKLNFDTELDFLPVSLVASLPQILVANTDFQATKISELTDLARAKAGTLNYASVGNGSPGHIAGEMYKLRARVEMEHVPYKGGGPAVTDVIGGQVPLLWVSLPAVAGFVKSGKLKALAVTTRHRSQVFPDVPTMIESGFADFEVDSWYAMFVPARTPGAVVTRLHAAITQTLKEPEIREKLLAQGAEAVGSSPEELAAIVRSEIPRWKKLVQDAAIKP